jgi:hypothetical protein
MVLPPKKCCWFPEFDLRCRLVWPRSITRLDNCRIEAAQKAGLYRQSVALEKTDSELSFELVLLVLFRLLLRGFRVKTE